MFLLLTYLLTYLLKNCRIWKLGPGSTILVKPHTIKPMHYRRTLCLKISSFDLELWEKERLALPHSDKISHILWCKQLPFLLCIVRRKIGKSASAA